MTRSVASAALAAAASAAQGPAQWKRVTSVPHRGHAARATDAQLAQATAPQQADTNRGGG